MPRKVNGFHYICLDMETFYIHQTWKLEWKAGKNYHQLNLVYCPYTTRLKGLFVKIKTNKMCHKSRESERWQLGSSCQVSQMAPGPSSLGGWSEKTSRAAPALNSAQHPSPSKAGSWGRFPYNYGVIPRFQELSKHFTNRKSFSETIPNNKVGTIIIMLPLLFFSWGNKDRMV